jgi:PAS domain S-box-containing protein
MATDSLDTTLRESEEQFKALFEASPIGISINNAEGRFLRANPVFQEIFGYTSEELGKFTFKDITFPEDLLASGKVFRELVEGIRQNFRIEKRYRRKNGSIMWANTACASVRDEDGRFIYTFAMVEDITESKLAETNLRASEEQFRSLFENSNDAVIIATQDGTIEAANQEACRIFGMTEDEIRAVGRKGVVDPLDERLPKLLEVRERTGHFKGELNFRRKDGSLFPGEVSSSFYRDRNGDPKASIIIRDVTDRRREENALHDLVAGTAAVTGEKFFPELVKFLASALGVRYALVSECVGTSVDRVRSLAFWSDHDWLPGIEYDVKDTTCEEVLNQGKTCFYKDHVQERFPKETALVTMQALCYLGTPLFGNNGETLGHIFVINNKELSNPERAKSIISIFAARAAMELQRKKDLEQIRDQARLLDEAHDAIVVTDLSHCITFWNKGAETLYGWSQEEARKKHIGNLLYSTDEELFGNASREAYERGIWNGEVRQKRKYGQEVIVQSRWTLVRSNEGEPRAILSINTDVTEKRKLESHFLRAQRMESIGTLAAGVAHDLNNVLTPILLAVETLLEKPDHDRLQPLLAMIDSNARRGADMANQVLTFARGVEGDRVPLEARHLIKEMEKIVRETFPRTIQIQSRIGPELHMIAGNATQLHQVLLNLSLNARDAMPSGGVLKLSGENVDLDQEFARMHPEAQPGQYLCLTVSDTGTGIEPEVLNRLFEPFFTSKGIGKGTGLGLSTVAGIVKSHQGFLTVYSELGKGSQFKVFLPAIIGRKDREERKERKLPHGNNELILLVDDEASIREVAKSTLEAHGYRVITATDGTDALSVYAKQGNEIDLVLTDMMMPYLDGLGTIKALERMNPRVRVIAASGLHSQQRLSKSDSPTIKAFIPKPFTAERLLVALNEVLTEHISPSS